MQEHPRNQSHSLQFDEKNMELKLTSEGAEVGRISIKDIFDAIIHPLLAQHAEAGGNAPTSKESTTVIEDFDYHKTITTAGSVPHDVGSQISNQNYFRTTSPSSGRIRFSSNKGFQRSSTLPNKNLGSKTTTRQKRWTTTTLPNRIVDSKLNSTPRRRTTSIPNRSIGSRMTTRQISRETSTPSVKITSSKDSPIMDREICGKRYMSRRLNITAQVLGGSDVKGINWPWMANIRMQNSFGMERFLCGGSLITPRHVLAAAHCFNRRNRNRNKLRYFVIFGSNRRNPNQSWNITKIEVAHVRIHDRYIMNEHYNDIALLLLIRDVEFNAKISPICLPTFEEGLLAIALQNVTVTGWGLTSLGGSGSNALQEASIQIVSLSQCRRAYAHLSGPSLHQGITGTMLCAGSEEGGIDACEGDSGGPLVMKVGDRWIQMGIVSFGYMCGLQDYPGVYTRVSSYMHWIRAAV